MTMWTELLGHAFTLDYVEVGGIHTRRFVAGQGEPILFLHGGGGPFGRLYSGDPRLST